MPALKQTSQSTIIELHPAAKAAHLWSKEMIRWIKRSELPLSLRAELAQLPLQCVVTADNYQLYAPVWTSVFWPSDQPPTGTLLICTKSNDISETAIAKAAWVSALSEIVRSIHPHAVSDIRDTLRERMPQSLHRELIGSKTLNDGLLCQWTGVSRATLGDQRRRKRKQISTPPATTPEILEALSRAWSRGE